MRSFDARKPPRLTLGQLVFLILRAALAWLTNQRTRARLQWLALRVSIAVIAEDLRIATGQAIAGPALRTAFVGVGI